MVNRRILLYYRWRIILIELLFNDRSTARKSVNNRKVTNSNNNNVNKSVDPRQTISVRHRLGNVSSDVWSDDEDSQASRHEAAQEQDDVRGDVKHGNNEEQQFCDHKRIEQQRRSQVPHQAQQVVAFALL